MSAAGATTAAARAAAVRLPVVEQGDADGVPVVVLHGLSDSWRSFEPVLPHLPPSLRLLAVTQRGHGDAPKPDDDYRVEQLAADVVGVLDDAGVERAIVAGHSMGSIVATRLALDAPERVAGLVLMGAKPTYDDPALDELYAVVEALEDPVDPVFVREFQESTLARPVTPGLLDTVVGESLKLPARVWHALTGPTLRADHSADLGRISVPTLMAWGDRDDIATRADQEALVDAIPGARLNVYRGGGHAFHWEDPAGFARDPRRFRRRARRRHREERLTMPAIHVNGIDLYHAVEGDGPPLVVVHGSWADHTNWRRPRRCSRPPFASSATTAADTASASGRPVRAPTPGRGRPRRAHRVARLRPGARRGQLVRRAHRARPRELLPEPMRATFLGNAPAFAAEQRDPDWSAVGTDALERFPGRILLTKGAAAALWLQLLVDRLAELLPSAPTATIANAGNVPHLTHPAEYAELVGAFLGNRAGEEIAAR